MPPHPLIHSRDSLKNCTHHHHAKDAWLQGGERTREEEVAEEEFPSVIPLLPPLTKDTWNDYLKMYLSAVALLIIFGGLVAPALELRMGVGGEPSPQFCPMPVVIACIAGSGSCLDMYIDMYSPTNFSSEAAYWV